MSLWFAYALLASGLMALGAALIGSGLAGSARPLGTALRALIAAGFLAALGGTVAVAVLEARAVQPW
ncbi:MAG TPA: hypothetical protein VLD61_08160 [Methylomirabilota bacterium]|nr:hypothetical protein [Methylomirabilota bacterium]